MLTKEEKRKINTEVVSKTILRTFLRYSIVTGIWCLTIAAFSLDIFNLEKDTFSFTNYGFAVMASYSAICFSWARNLAPEEKNKTRRVNQLAESSIYGGITFILGSTFKYIYILRKGDLFLFSMDLSVILKYLAYICLTYAVLMFCAVSIHILKVIDEDFSQKLKKRLTVSKKNQKIMAMSQKKLLETIEKYRKKEPGEL